MQLISRLLATALVGLLQILVVLLLLIGLLAFIQSGGHQAVAEWITANWFGMGAAG